MKRIVALVSLLLLAVPGSPGAAEPDPVGTAPRLLWPTDAGRCVTSSFCEFRPGHFHSGIDISTGGRVGFRALAVGDGEIVRARVSCGGYGRAVYLRLTDGRTAVFAHLSRFEGALASLVRRRQEAAGTSWVDVDLPPGSFPVRGGDLVGWTGQSGVGVPHLHVEIRDADGRPLDPLRSGLVVPDSIAPRITRVALTPLGPASSVDGRSETVILDVLPGEDATTGRLARTIPVEGEIGISLEIDETTDPCRYRLAPSRLELLEDGEILHAVEYSGFSFAETGRQDFQIDPRFSYPKVGRFHHLWRRPGNDLPFSEETRPAAGVVRAGRIPEKERRFLVPAGAPEGLPGLPLLGSVQRPGVRVRTLIGVAQDAAGNRGEVTIALSFAAPPSVAVLHAERLLGRRAPPSADGSAGVDSASAALFGTWIDTLRVDGALRDPGRDVREVRLDLSWDGGTTWIPRPPAFPSPDLSFHARLPVRRLVPGAGGRPVLVRAQPVDVLGAAGLPVCVGAGDEPPPGLAAEPPAFRLVTIGPWIELRFGEEVPFGGAAGGWEAWPGGAGNGEDLLSAVLVRPWGRGIRIVTGAGPGGFREWAGSGGEWRGFDPWGRPVPVRFEAPARIEPGAGGAAASADGRARVRFSPSVFREPVVPTVRTEPAPVPGTELTAVGSLYVLETGHVPLAEAYELSLGPPPGESFDPDRVGIFVQENGRFRYIGGEASPDSAGWTAETRTLLPVGLFEDVTAPALSAPRLEERFGRVALRFRAEDGGAGIDCDDVEVFLDGNPVLAELDDETGDVLAFPPIASESGAGGVFEIRAVDRCGNPARRTDEVRIP